MHVTRPCETATTAPQQREQEQPTRTEYLYHFALTQRSHEQRRCTALDTQRTEDRSWQCTAGSLPIRAQRQERPLERHKILCAPYMHIAYHTTSSMRTPDTTHTEPRALSKHAHASSQLDHPQDHNLRTRPSQTRFIRGRRRARVGTVQIGPHALTCFSSYIQNSSKIELRCAVLGPACFASLRLNQQRNMNLPLGESLQYCRLLRGSGAP